jgi:hypothetical protein
MLGTQMLCMKDEARHVLMWHLGPVVAAAFLGVALGRLLLGRPTRRTAP